MKYTNIFTFCLIQQSSYTIVLPSASAWKGLSADHPICFRPCDSRHLHFRSSCPFLELSIGMSSNCCWLYLPSPANEPIRTPIWWLLQLCGPRDDSMMTNKPATTESKWLRKFIRKPESHLSPARSLLWLDQISSCIFYRSLGLTPLCFPSSLLFLVH